MSPVLALWTLSKTYSITMGGMHRSREPRRIFSIAMCISQSNNGPVTFIGNISANSSSEGAQFRSGGTIIDNLFVADSLGFSVGDNPAGSRRTVPYTYLYRSDK